MKFYLERVEGNNLVLLAPDRLSQLYYGSYMRRINIKYGKKFIILLFENLFGEVFVLKAIQKKKDFDFLACIMLACLTLRGDYSKR